MCIRDRFKSVSDFISRVNPKNINKLQLEGLVKAGVFDEFDKDRNKILNSIPKIIQKIKNINDDKENHQSNLFDEQEKGKEEFDFESSSTWSVKELLSEEFVSEFDQRLSRLADAHAEKSIKHVLAKATRQQLSDGSPIQHLSNPVIVAIFLKTSFSLDGRELDLAGLSGAMKEFEQKNHEHIKLLTEQIQTGEKDELGSVADDEHHVEEEFEKRIPALEDEVYKIFLDLLPAEKQERTEEDLEVFLVDFHPPNIKEWDSGMVKHFIGEWFVENANPLKEDLDSMRESLLSLFQFLDREELLQKGVFDQVSEFLEK